MAMTVSQPLEGKEHPCPPCLAQCPVYNRGTSLTCISLFEFKCVIYVTEAGKILCLLMVTSYYSMGPSLFFNKSCKTSISLAF